MKHANWILLCLGAACGAGLIGGWVAALLVLVARPIDAPAKIEP